MDKIAKAGLTLEDPEEIRKQFYSIETSEHTAFYGEIVAAYVIE